MDFGVIFGVFANIISFGLLLSPLPTIVRIVKDKDTQDFSSLPYAVTLMQCLFWVIYALPVVTKGAILVLTVNSVGVLIEGSYVIVFFLYSYTRPDTRTTIKALALILVGLAVVAPVTLGLLPFDSRSPLVGTVSVLVAITMYLSPLSIMRLVIRTRNVKYMPLLLSVFLFLNGVSWVGYAFFHNDNFVLIPNLIGAISSTAQLILYAIYRKGPDSDLSDKLLGEDQREKIAP